MPGVLPATFAVFRFGPFKDAVFRVTRKGRSENPESRSAHVPRLLVVLLALSLVALTWGVATFVGVTPITYERPAAVLGASAFMLLNIALLVAAIRRIRAARFAGERRAGVRFDVKLRGLLDGVLVEITDVSLTGARALVPSGTDTSGLSDHPTLTIALPGERVALETEIVRVDASGGALDYGLLFKPDQRKERAQLARALFAGYSTRQRQRWQRESAERPPRGGAAGRLGRNCSSSSLSACDAPEATRRSWGRASPACGDLREETDHPPHGAVPLPSRIGPVCQCIPRPDPELESVTPTPRSTKPRSGASLWCPHPRPPGERASRPAAQKADGRGRGGSMTASQSGAIGKCPMKGGGGRAVPLPPSRVASNTSVGPPRVQVSRSTPQ